MLNYNESCENKEMKIKPGGRVRHVEKFVIRRLETLTRIRKKNFFLLSLLVWFAVL